MAQQGIDSVDVGCEQRMHMRQARYTDAWTRREGEGETQAAHRLCRVDARDQRCEASGPRPEDAPAAAHCQSSSMVCSRGGSCAPLVLRRLVGNRVTGMWSRPSPPLRKEPRNARCRSSYRRAGGAVHPESRRA